MAPPTRVRRVLVEPRSPKSPLAVFRRPSWSFARIRSTQLKIYSFVLCTAIVAGSHLLAQDYKSFGSLQWPGHEAGAHNSRLANPPTSDAAAAAPQQDKIASPQWPSALHNSSLILVQSLVVKLLRGADGSELGTHSDDESDEPRIIVVEPQVDFDAFVSSGDIVEAAKRRIAKGKKTPFSASALVQLRKLHGDADLARRRRTNPAACTAQDVVWATLGRRASNAPFVPPHCAWLDLSGSGLDDRQAAEVAAALRRHPRQLVGLDLRRNNIGPAGAAALAVALQQGQPQLPRSGGATGDDEEEEAAAPLALQSLNLASNRLGDVGVAALARGLAAPSCHLKVLLAHHNGVGDAGATALSNALSKNPGLKTLLLTNNNIGDAGAEALGRALARQGAQRRLATDGVSHRGGSSGRKSALFAAASNEDEGLGLASLGLSSNRVGDAGAAALGAALAAGSGLEELFLSWGRAPLGDAGAASLARGVQDARNPRLSALHLTGNRVGPAGAAALLDAFDVTPLGTLGLELNEVPASELRRFKKYT